MTDSKPSTVFFQNATNDAPVQIFQCQRHWNELQMTSQVDVRFCDGCRQSVYLVVDAAGFQSAVSDAKCVMVAGYSVGSDEVKHFVGQTSGSSYQVTETKLTWGD